MTAAVRKAIACKIGIYMVLVLTFFLLLGGSILNFFGISIAAVKIAGGIVVFEAGWQALKEKSKLTPKDTRMTTSKLELHEDISFIPMTIPLLAGPGSIAVTLGLAAQAGQRFALTTLTNLLAAVLAIILISILAYLCLCLSSWFLQRLGETGITAISRLLGLFILAVGVQLILHGLTDWVVSLTPEEKTSLGTFLLPKM